MTMTLPSPVASAELELDSEQELSRVTVLVGELSIDVGVPDLVSISTIVSDVIDLANGQLAGKQEVNFKFDSSEGKWTFTRLTGEVLDPSKTLGEAGVNDGELLVVREAAGHVMPPLVDDIEDGLKTADGIRPWFAEQRWVAGWFGGGIALCAAAALIAPGSSIAFRGVPIAPCAMIIVGITCAAMALGVVLRPGNSPAPVGLAAMGMLLIAGGSAHVVPQARGAEALSMALALPSLVALAQTLGSARGRPLYSGVIATALLGVPAALARMLWHPNLRTLGTVVALVAVVVVYLAPRITIVLSGLPVPRVPTAGEPLDDIETQGGTQVEGVSAVGKQVIPTEQGIVEQVCRARDHLTGIVGAAAVVAAVSCYFALDVTTGFYWQEVVFGFALATVLCLRGRSHHDLAQSAALIGYGLVIAIIVITKTATFFTSWQVDAAVALMTLTGLLVWCGLVAPNQEFSPVMRRWVEIIEALTIVLIFPVACSIIGLYTVFRELRL